MVDGDIEYKKRIEQIIYKSAPYANYEGIYLKDNILHVSISWWDSDSEHQGVSLPLEYTKSKKADLDISFLEEFIKEKKSKDEKYMNAKASAIAKLTQEEVKILGLK